MKAAAELRRLPVEAVSRLLLDEVGDAVRQDRVKQMVGSMIRQIMEANGYALDASNRPVLYGGVFTKASRYRRNGQWNKASAGLTAAELR